MGHFQRLDLDFNIFALYVISYLSRTFEFMNFYTEVSVKFLWPCQFELKSGNNVGQFTKGTGVAQLVQRLATG